MVLAGIQGLGSLGLFLNLITRDSEDKYAEFLPSGIVRSQSSTFWQPPGAIHQMARPWRIDCIAECIPSIDLLKTITI